MGQINLTAQLVAAPASSTDQTFPSGTTTIPFTTTPPPKTYNNDTGRNNISNFASPSAYVPLGGLGASDQPVSKATIIYVRTSSPFLMRITVINGGGTTVVAGLPIQGVFLLELPNGSEATLVELQGVGAVEYYFAGLS